MDFLNAKRILIVGCSGSGKSTLARWVGTRLALPVVHMDLLFWKPGWVETSRDELREKIKIEVKKEAWVMDGTGTRSFDLRFPVADVLIVISFSPISCIYRAFRRVFQYDKINRRPDMAEGCDESIDLGFYKYIWNYNRDVLPKVEKAIDEYGLRGRTIYLRNQKEVDHFMIKYKEK